MLAPEGVPQTAFTGSLQYSAKRLPGVTDVSESRSSAGVRKPLSDLVVEHEVSEAASSTTRINEFFFISSV
ncbi:MAG: hypothetical protein H7222_17010 [Methylotenera sp.]|nr:hypothetical protein [Oligoflexia bacterium]